ncbi:MULTISPECIES: FAD-dependent oxidoreductase [unclassified Ensifer]|jgi:3-phenylpropionate/trans-cinnamate dioxygenase ferredoxin reductase component|uniref:NAD(P)/FAD-dependent oxidoreductase n=1 Tax=unclassified Ensifer TaxID=2633371 RepID=UPI000708BE6B|nr:MULTISPECIES: FAD-dependent oxidoreductase [unclassified Ensifer]KQU87726.1 ferredoxin reductase [Ensifer sp. Root31]KQW52700.1 ferredoxin reductase [Ensifer sp. Root1252]KQW78582.1 ferredoxin reductase [Ensifer sp. Root127]KQY68522.1 ferredoxin reductase [Ensifer sp. Root142]KRC71113.1 ferredoxin reductase [Ensifer sp. Root231]
MGGIVIIGAGECGTRAAFALREAGFLEAVTLVGSEPHLPYERPPLSKPIEGAVQLKPICGAQALEASGIDYLQGVSASSIDVESHTVALSDGRVLTYGKLLLATGARPRRLTCPGAERALDFRTYADAETIFSGAEIGKSVAIVGGGLIGMELAAVLRKKRVAVSIIEAAPKPLGRAVPTRFAAKLHARHLGEGVQFHLGQGVAEITDDAVYLADRVVVPADIVVAAIGVQPDMALAEAVGLATGNGVLVDISLRTSNPDIFAAGDCAAVSLASGGHVRFESWRNARSQAETAARNMVGGNDAFLAIPWFWTDQYDLGLQVAGLPQPAHQAVVRCLAEGELEFYLDGGRLVAAAGLGAGNTIAKDIKLAEMLIAAGAAVDAASLADPAVNLKTLLKSARAA